MYISSINKALIKLNQTAEKVSLDQVVDETYAIIADRLAYSSQEKAEEMSKELGCEGFHVHELEGQSWYMPCEYHELKEPCQAGYEQYGMKRKNGRLVPNCIPIQ